MADSPDDVMLVYTLSLLVVGVVIGAGTAQGAISILPAFLLVIAIVGIWYGLWYRVVRD